MRHLPNRFRYQFYPVGQGLFASGSILQSHEHTLRFQWVYDCGTISSQKLVEAAIIDLGDSVEGRERLDLVTISHFDKDHISGISQLVSKFPIGTLMLPYMPLAQRLVLAFEEGIRPGDELMDFFSNPVAYFTSREGAQIERILFVPPSGKEGSAQLEPRSTRPIADDRNHDLIFDSGDPPDTDELMSLTSNVKGVRVEFLERGGVIRTHDFWEWVPYNDDPEEEIPDTFRHQVNNERESLLRTESIARRKLSLQKLKAIYDKQFGDRSEDRNIISLSLYGGTIDSGPTACQSFSCVRYLTSPHFRKRSQEYSEIVNEDRNRASILYTGDSFLDTPRSLSRLMSYLRMQRIERIGVFQVMHHGSEKSWHKSVASAIGPIWSVFSSDPEDKRFLHPHADVLRDFWTYCPVQVDKKTGVIVCGIIG